MNEENVDKPSDVPEPTPEVAESPTAETVPQETEGSTESTKSTESTESTESQPQPVEEPKRPPPPVFRLKLNAKVLEAIFTAIKCVVEEASFTVSVGAVKLKALDSSRVAMVVFEYPKEAFEEFSVDREGQIAFDVKEALKVLKRLGKEDTAELVMLSDSVRLFLKVHGKYERVFDLPILEPEAEELPEPKLSFETQVKLSVEALNNAVEDAALVSDHVSLIAQPEILQLKAKGDYAEADVKFVKGLSPDLLSLEKTDISKPTKAIYSLNYLSEIAKGLKTLANVVTLDYSTETPVKIQAQDVKGSMTYYLAPRIEVE